ncbi:MAG: winged helix-turn-helix transcriptional regulator [Desulfurococcales archaeon]|nr:winged helix-turn-helix transcriptional regulator [Desulfurococcales archaeon]
MSTNIDKLVLSYLQKHPYSKPREIADGLGFSIVTVRYSLLRLRERGLVVRTSKGYIARSQARKEIQQERAAEQTYAPQGEADISKEIGELKERVTELEKTLEDALENLSKLEKELSELKVFIKALQTVEKPQRQRDQFLEILSQEKLMTIAEARKEVSKHMESLEYYIDRGDVVVVGDFIVDKQFYESLISRMPIKVDEINALSAKEKILVEAMISEGIVYIDKGKEIKPI